METRWASGLDSLRLVTDLLQAARLEHPTAGSWEAADFQWWWRVERESDSMEQLFLIGDDGAPVGAAIFTRWSSGWGFEVLTRPSTADAAAALVELSADRLAALEPRGIESIVRDDDENLIGVLTDAGFVKTDETDATTWLDAARRPEPTAPPEGYRLLDRSETADRPHHFITRSGEGVEERLQQTSLYDPTLDLLVVDDADGVAGYVLFWFDPVTNTGLVEPVRTEEGHERRGVARHILTTGIDRLARRGAERIKVNFQGDNPGARALYLGLGFEIETTSTVHRLD